MLSFSSSMSVRWSGMQLLTDAFATLFKQIVNLNSPYMQSNCGQLAPACFASETSICSYLCISCAVNHVSSEFQHAG